MAQIEVKYIHPKTGKNHRTTTPADSTEQADARIREIHGDDVVILTTTVINVAEDHTYDTDDE